MPVNKHKNEIEMLKFVHDLQLKSLHVDLASLRSDALRWEIESVYMMHLLKQALQWAKHTNNDGLSRKIAKFLEHKRFINDDKVDGSEEDEIDGNEPEPEDEE